MHLVNTRSNRVNQDRAITRAQFATPHPELRRYITTYYIAEVDSPDGGEICDLLHPEWGSVRFLCRGAARGSVIPNPMVAMPAIAIAGPTSRAAPVACVSLRVASFGLLPLGWHRFIGQPAHQFADRSVEPSEIAARIDVSSLFPAVQAAETLTEIAAIFDSFLLEKLQSQRQVDSQEETNIEATHRAIVDPEVAAVSELTERLGITTVQLERLSKRVFGFPPKLLLRRQRFLRTLALVLRQPQAKWAEVLDPRYYDQAHFNRDFQRFFGMSPKHYLSLPQPIVAVAARERMKALGDPLQGLQMPGGHEPGIALAE
jgi:AraC-like DNA-binding protein